MTLNSVVLPEPFGPDQAGHGALLDGDRRAVQRLDAAVGLRDPLGAQQRGHRAPPELTGGRGRRRRGRGRAAGRGRDRPPGGPASGAS